MTKLQNTLVAIASISLLAACGQQPGERALSGAGIGAGTGAVAGALAGDPVSGAVIGGAVGAAAGGLTKPSDINLGKPAWK